MTGSDRDAPRPPFSDDSPASVHLGRLGVWSNVDHLSGREVLAFARRVEDLRFDALWVQEGAGREPFALLGALLQATDRITLGVGIASVYARDAMAARGGALTLGELSSGRFVLGLGVSHVSRVEGQRGQTYLPPIPTMRAYLDAYAAAPYLAPRPVPEPPVVVAALRRRMLELAATRSDGAFPYFVPVDYVARARETIDRAAIDAGRAARPALIVSVPAILESDPEAARETARRYTESYLKQPNYRTNLLECGFDEHDLAGAGSDRLVDALVAWGDADGVRLRIAGYQAAGADHVAIIPLAPDGRHASLPVLEALAG
jgi:probable F420-dependent oxidoreductase